MILAVLYLTSLAILYIVIRLAVAGALNDHRKAQEKALYRVEVQNMPERVRLSAQAPKTHRSSFVPPTDPKRGTP